MDVFLSSRWTLGLEHRQSRPQRVVKRRSWCGMFEQHFGRDTHVGSVSRRAWERLCATSPTLGFPELVAIGRLEEERNLREVLARSRTELCPRLRNVRLDRANAAVEERGNLFV